MAGGSKTVIDGLYSVNTFTTFLLQIMLIIALARVLAVLLKKLHQPTVVAEIIGTIPTAHTPRRRAARAPQRACVNARTRPQLTSPRSPTCAPRRSPQAVS